MKIFNGKTVCGGTSTGICYVLNHNEHNTQVHESVSKENELRRISGAILNVGESLQKRAENEENATVREILELHNMMLEDEDILSSLIDTISAGGVTAEEAVVRTEEAFTKMLLDTNDEYMMARADDVRDICRELKLFLTGDITEAMPDEPFVLIVDELLPSDLTRFAQKRLSGIITRTGSIYSHVAIMIRALNIPALIVKDTNAIRTGMSILIDGDSGRAYLEPDVKAKATLFESRHVRNDNIFTSGKLSCAICVNIGSAHEAKEALFDTCDGIGLFRTEFLYIGRRDLPSEDEQFDTYKLVLEAAHGKPVVIRTFDLGADKQSEALPLEAEANPALGCRGLRVYSVYPDAFMTQIRSLLRASVYGDLRIMYPMVTSCAEMHELRARVLDVAKSLEKENIPFRIPPQGAMIETPAAVMISAELAKCSDFFSVGTNDLTQYTYAADRLNTNTERIAESDNTALLRLIELAVSNAHNAGIKIGICGELAANVDMIKAWTDMRIDSLSVSPSVLKK